MLERHRETGTDKEKGGGVHALQANGVGDWRGAWRKGREREREKEREEGK